MIAVRVLSVLIVLSVWVFSKQWSIKRDPFRVSKEYMESTGKHYLEPKSNYIPFEIKVVGVFFDSKRKEVFLDLGSNGMYYVRERQSIDIDTPDVKSILKVEDIYENYVIISVNSGEGIRYDIEKN